MANLQLACAAGTYGILALLRSLPGVPLAGPEDLRPGCMLGAPCSHSAATAGLIVGIAPALAGPRMEFWGH